MIQVLASKDHILIARLNEEIQMLHHSLYPDIFKPFHQRQMEKAFEKMLAQENAFAYIATYEDQPAAYILTFVVGRKESVFMKAFRSLYIDQLLVLEAFRKKGIGSALMQQAKLVAREKGLDTIQLDHWSANEGARHFFLQQGFSYYNERMFLPIN